MRRPPHRNPSAGRGWSCRLRYEVRERLSTLPWPYLPLMRMRYGEHENKVVQRDTQVVIDGFQRSGNTFSIEAFESAQPEPVRIAHHLHATSQIIQAVRWGIPAVALIRPPRETVLSHIIRRPCLTPRQALSNWVRFYDHALPYRDRVVVADFAQVTTDFGAVIRRINERFGTGFVPFEHTEENVRACWERIEERNARRYGTILETHVARPSAARDELKGHLEEDYASPALSALRARAEATYLAMVSPVPPGG